MREITGSVFFFFPQETKSDRCGGLVLTQLFWELRSNAGSPFFFKYLKFSRRIANGSRKKLFRLSRNMFRKCENCRKAGGHLIRSFASLWINEHKLPVEVGFVSSEAAALALVLRPQIKDTLRLAHCSNGQINCWSLAWGDLSSWSEDRH